MLKRLNELKFNRSEIIDHDRFTRCLACHKLLQKFGSNPKFPKIVNGPKYCDYCKLEKDIEQQGQQFKVKIDRANNITEHNHVALIMGLLLNKPIECEFGKPLSLLEQIRRTRTEDLNIKHDVTELVLLNARMRQQRISEEDRKEVLIRSDIISPTVTIKTLEVIERFLNARPEFMNTITSSPWIGTDTLAAQRGLFFHFGTILSLIKKDRSEAIKQISKVLKDRNLPRIQKLKITGAILGEAKHNIFDDSTSAKLRAVNKTVSKLNPHVTTVLDLFARRMNSKSTTGIFLNHKFKVLAVGIEVNRFMRSTEDLTFIGADVFEFLRTLDKKFNLICVDPYGHFPIKQIIRLSKLTSYLFWTVCHTKTWRNKRAVLKLLSADFEIVPVQEDRDDFFKEYLTKIREELPNSGIKIIREWGFRDLHLFLLKS